MTRVEQLVEALILVSRADHYMVGIVEPVTLNELEGAKQALIDKENALTADDSLTNTEAIGEGEVVGRALDLVEHAITTRLRHGDSKSFLRFGT